MTENENSGARPLVLGAVVVVILVVGAFAFLSRQDPVPQVVETPQPVTEAATVAPQDPATAEATPQAAEPEPDPVPEVVAEPAPEPAPQPPTFDTFRVDPNGAMVIAGRAEPGQVVAIILAGEPIERVTADGSGSFVALPMAGPSDQPRRLSLLADPDGLAVASETTYIVAPIAPPVIVPAVPEVQAPPVVAAEPTEETPQPEVAESAPQDDPVTPMVAAAAPVPTVLQADASGVRVVQDAGEAEQNVALDAITYDPTGEVQLSGRATGDGAVQVYIDNAPVTTSQVTAGGDWQIALPQIDTGVYTLRIDEVDTDGAVVSRMETPFKREEPAEVAAVLAEETAAEGFEVAVKTVQPGATLWAIAEENLGAGILYVKVFEANSDLIRDPDLIYPGQIFRIPEITE